MKTTGNVDWDGLGRRIEAAMPAAVFIAGEHLAGVSSELAPLEEGTLSRSADVTTEAAPGRASACVSYATPYAVIQHENLGFRHDPGRQAKYLEQPMGTEAGTLLRVMGAAMRKALG